MGPSRTSGGYLARHFEVGVPISASAWTPLDFEAAIGVRHKTQSSEEAVERVPKVMRDVWNGELRLSPMVPQPPANDLFHRSDSTIQRLRFLATRPRVLRAPRHQD
jgi:hypothetical protein